MFRHIKRFNHSCCKKYFGYDCWLKYCSTLGTDSSSSSAGGYSASHVDECIGQANSTLSQFHNQCKIKHLDCVSLPMFEWTFWLVVAILVMAVLLCCGCCFLCTTCCPCGGLQEVVSPPERRRRRGSHHSRTSYSSSSR